MKIAIDFTSARSGGGIAYARGLLKGISEVDPENQYLVFVCTDQNNLRLDLPGNIRYKILSLWSNHLIFRAIWQQIGLPFWLVHFGADVVYTPTELVPYLSSVPAVSLFQNWLPFVGDEKLLKMGFPRRASWKMRLQYNLARIAAKRARSVIFVSEASCRAISQNLGLPAKRAAVVHHGIDVIYRNNSNATIDKELPQAPFILAVGDITLHKNHSTLAVAFARLVQRDGLPHHLVLIGHNWFKKTTPEYRRILDSAGLSDRVHMLGSVSLERLTAIYDLASILVLPSYVETFGFPVLEAMSRGVPVAATRFSAAPEICGDAAVYFDPWCADEMADAMLSVLADPIKGRALGKMGYERSLRYDWSNTARRTLDVLRNAADLGKER